MSMYITRNVGFRENNTVSPNLFMNFLRSAELSVVENTDMQYVLSGGRDARRIAWLMEEPEVRVEFDPLSLYTMYWALGSLSGASTAWTIVPSSTLPLITTWREMTEVGSAPSEAAIKTLKIYDGKVNSYELSFGKGEVATANMSIMGKGANLGTTVATQTVDYTKEPMAFYDADVFVNGSRLSTSTLPDVAISITVENNLTRRPTVSTVYGYRSYVIAEGGLDVSGRLTVGAYALSALGEVIDRSGDNTIQLRIAKTHGGNFTSTITMPQVLFTDFPERLRGIDPYEVEIPFQCVPLGSEPAIKVIMSGTIL